MAGSGEPRRFTPRDLRDAVILAAIVTTVVVIALLDPSCAHLDSSPEVGPSHSVVPR